MTFGAWKAIEVKTCKCKSKGDHKRAYKVCRSKISTYMTLVMLHYSVNHRVKALYIKQPSLTVNDQLR